MFRFSENSEFLECLRIVLATVRMQNCTNSKHLWDRDPEYVLLDTRITVLSHTQGMVFFLSKYCFLEKRSLIIFRVFKNKLEDD
jgi:hypothetical protein